MKSFKHALSVFTILVLTACGEDNSSAPPENSGTPVLPINDADVGGSEVGTARADGSAPMNVQAPGGRAPHTSGDVPSAADAAIPTALHGRWGLTPGDCTSRRGDAKGLLTVGSEGLRFYESRATPARNVKRSPDSFSADFDFEGEGQSWTKFQTLTLQGQTLVRTESSPMASFTYARCD